MTIGESSWLAFHHRLVQEDEALSYPPVTDEDVALPEGGEREEIPVSELLAELGAAAPAVAAARRRSRPRPRAGRRPASACIRARRTPPRRPAAARPVRASQCRAPSAREERDASRSRTRSGRRVACSPALAHLRQARSMGCSYRPRAQHVRGDREQLEICTANGSCSSTRASHCGRPTPSGRRTCGRLFAGAGEAHRRKP